MRPYLKNNQHKKRAGEVAQVVECLPSKCEAMNSNSSATGKKKIRALASDLWIPEVKGKSASLVCIHLTSGDQLELG
jgi:hypothetical protein